MEVWSVSQVAKELAVSPRHVRQLLASGRLRGQQVGRSWVIQPDDVERLQRMRVGRPWAASSAWAVLEIAHGANFEMSPVERFRARERLASSGIQGLVAQLRPRAENRRYYAHPSALGRLLAEEGVVRGGVSAAGDHGADLIADSSAEFYVRRSRLAGLVDRYALEGDVDRPNVLGRIVEDDDWPFAHDANVAPWPVVAVDLLDAADDRSHRAGLQLVEQHT
jgi:excisionase family DNA binding protein